jgi:hypothetical protein
MPGYASSTRLWLHNDHYYWEKTSRSSIKLGTPYFVTFFLEKKKQLCHTFVPSDENNETREYASTVVREPNRYGGVGWTALIGDALPTSGGIWTMLKGVFGYGLLKFNTHHINVPSNVWSTKCRLIAYMSAQIRSNLRDESIKPN